MYTFQPTGETRLSSKIDKFFDEIKIGTMIKRSNFYKEKGVACSVVLKYIFTMLFTNKNMYSAFLQSSGQFQVPFQKDVVYRFLNSPLFNWKQLLHLISSKLILKRLVPLTTEKRTNVFVVDNSLYDRNRSKCVELLTTVKDNIDGIYKKGFRLLTLGWSDGNTFVPINFSLLSSTKKKQRCSINEKIDKRTNGYKRRREALETMPDATIRLLQQAQSFGIPAQYVLFDSWFAFPKIIRQVKALNLDCIAMLKPMWRVLYEYDGHFMNLKRLYARVRKKRGRARILASVIVGLGPQPNTQPMRVKIVFVRDRKQSKQWLALVTTDLSLSDEEVVRIYGKRWDIEVFFKMCKSYLNLAKEFQGRSYDAMIAQTSIVFLRYMMLSLEKRKHEDNRTMGSLFYHCQEELRDIEFTDVLSFILQILSKMLTEKFAVTKSTIHEIIDEFIKALPPFIGSKLLLSSCES